MPNLLLSFLATLALLSVGVCFALLLINAPAWLLINAPAWLFQAVLAACVFTLAWAFVHEVVAARRGR